MRHSGGRRVRTVAWALAGFTVLELAVALVLTGLNAGQMGTAQTGIYGVSALAGVMYAGIGRLIASRVPGNAIGWLLCLIGLSLAAIMLTEQYALYGLATAPGSLPAARLAGWLSGTLFVPAFAPVFFLVLLFPDGRLPSRRWRPVLWAMVAATAAWAVLQLQADTTINGGITNALDFAGVSYPNPLGIFPQHGWFSGLLAVLLFLGLATGVLAVASVFARWRSASAELRHQLAWLGYVGALTVLPVAVFVPNSLIGNGHVDPLSDVVFWGFVLVAPAMIGIPVACAVAVLKHRLYEIDRLISRTVAYAIVTGLLVGVYAVLVLLATRVLPLSGSVAVAGSTLAAAALFSPLRSRVQRMVDRHFNRTRYDADQTVRAFAARLKDTVDPDAVRADLLNVVQRSLEPTHAAAWTQQSV
jgi:hypothetical protein